MATWSHAFTGDKHELMLGAVLMLDLQNAMRLVAAFPSCLILLSPGLLYQLIEKTPPPPPTPLPHHPTPASVTPKGQAPAEQ